MSRVISMEINDSKASSGSDFNFYLLNIIKYRKYGWFPPLVAQSVEGCFRGEVFLSKNFMQEYPHKN